MKGACGWIRLACLFDALTGASTLTETMCESRLKALLCMQYRNFCQALHIGVLALALQASGKKYIAGVLRKQWKVRVLHIAPGMHDSMPLICQAIQVRVARHLPASIRRVAAVCTCNEFLEKRSV